MLLDKIKRNLITGTIRLLMMLNAIFEIRILRTSQGTMSGYFDNAESAITAIEPYVGKYDIYFTLNPPDPALLERSHNKLTSYAKQTTADGDIVKLNWLLVDLDPIRKPGIASTNEEKRSAFELANTVIKGLHKDFGFPDPVICDSGNGFHLLYKVDMENTPENVSVLKNLLSALDIVYSTDAAKVDRVTFNPARITKLYGVKTVKGSDSPERPHRWSVIKKIPDEILPVPISAMNRVIDFLPKTEDADDTPVTSGDNLGGFDIENWLLDANLGLASIKEVVINGNEATVYVLDVCPWNSEHINHSARITKFKNGGIAAGCFHDSCSDKNWHSLRDIIEPGWSDKKKSSSKSNKPAKESQLDKILEVSQEANFFHNTKKEAFAVVSVKNCNEVYHVESMALENWMRYKYLLATNRTFGSDAWKQAVGIFRAKALHMGDKIQVYRRLAYVDNSLFYDLNNELREVVHITDEGWEILQGADVYFYRPESSLEQVAPVMSDIDISLFDKYYKFKREDDKILHLISLIAKFIPCMHHPVDVIHGEFGASKTTTLRKDISFVDPNVKGVSALPKTVEALITILNGSYYVCFDNITSISAEMSDILCIAVTGGTYTKRTLYSNIDETILQLLNCIGMTGINIVATRPDLLDRSVLLELERIPPSELKPERKMWKEFDVDKPILLGMIFSILSKALKIYPTVELSTLGRMADFTEWGYAIAEAAGIGGERFLSAYLENRTQANSEAVEAHPVAFAIRKFIENKIEWIGSATELLKLLNELSEKETIDTSSLLWPKQGNVLSKRLREVKPSLQAIGIVVEIIKTGDRLIRIQKVS